MRRPLLFASLLVVGLLSVVSAHAQYPSDRGFFNDYIIVNGSYYKTDVANAGDNTNGPLPSNLGSFDRTSGTLTIGAQLNTYENSGNAVSLARVFYRVYPTTNANGTAGPAAAFRFNPVTIPQESQAGNGNRRFQTPANATGAAASGNLIRYTSGPGSYTLELYIQADGNNANFPIYDSKGGANYKTDFTVTGAAPASTTWLGGPNPTCVDPGPANSGDWFEPFNWSNGVPVATTDAVVPNYGAGCTVYPNVNSTAATGPALVRNLTINGLNTTDRGLARLVTGELKLYGDFVDQANGFIQRDLGTLTLAGVNQTFAREPYQTLRIEGGGVKTVNNNGENVQIATTIRKSLVFVNGIVNTGPQTISLADNSGANIVGESDVAYLLGIVQTYERCAPGTTQDFNNIGLSLTFTGADPGNVRVIRTTGIPVVTAGKPSISRTFGIQPDVSASRTAQAVFSYFDHETKNVTAGGITQAQLDKSKFTFYVSGNGGSNFTDRGRTSTDGMTQVTLNTLTQFATTTLGEASAPLPVRMLYFTAIHAPTGALVQWGTATELNSSGFEVQVSTDGTSFTTIGRVKSAAATSGTAHDYRFTDTEARSGTRYYRLRQVDLDGTASYTPVRTLTFEGGSGEAFPSAGSVFPNPFRETDQLLVAVELAQAGTVQLRMTDVLGHEVSREVVTMGTGAATIALPRPQNLPVGLYIVRLMLPNGKSQQFKVQKD